MRRSVHWRDLLIGAAGLWLIASPASLGFDLDNVAALNAYGVGFFLMLFCLISAWRLEDLGNEIVNVLAGSWLALSPYALGYSDQRPVVLNFIVAGSIVVALALWDLCSIPNPR